MTDDRKEPTLSPLKPDQDEIVRHRQRTSGGASGRPPSANRTGTHSTTGTQRPVVVKSSKLAPFAFLLAITGLGLAGFSYWQLMEAQKETQAAVARIAELEDRLEMTGDESEASMAALQAKLKWADSEIRKLWGVSYDTNRKAIAANEGAIASLNTKIGNVESQLTSGLNNVRGEIRKAGERLDSQQAQVKQFEQTRVQLQQQTQQVADTVRQVRESQSNLQDRVRTNEQAIEAIDTFRRSVNQDLLQLKAQRAQQGTAP